MPWGPGCSTHRRRVEGAEMQVGGPGQRAFAAINGLPDFLFCAPDERPVEAS